jgi:hypothetical protein
MFTEKKFRFLLVIGFFVLISLACDAGDLILRTTRKWLCEHTGGVWVETGTSDQGVDQDNLYYYCDRGDKHTPRYSSEISDELHETTSDEETPYDTTFFGDYHGDECSEVEGTFKYKWSVNLFFDTTKNKIVGAVKFHECPGGGRVLYSVTGEIINETLIVLYGEKQSGAGALFNNSPKNQNFNFNPELGEIVP